MAATDCISHTSGDYELVGWVDAEGFLVACCQDERDYAGQVILTGTNARIRTCLQFKTPARVVRWWEGSRFQHFRCEQDHYRATSTTRCPITGPISCSKFG